MRLAGIGLAHVEPGEPDELLTAGCGRFGADGRTCVRALTPDDPVRIASISKLVTAIGVMRLVEAGRLDLDADVGRYLGYPLRNPAYPDRPITLRQLFAHNSGLRDGSDYVVPLGARLKSALADPSHWDAGHPPGAYFTYSNFGVVVTGTVMEAATGERFDRLMNRQVLEPLGLDARYNWSGASAATAARAATLYMTTDTNGGWHPDGPWIGQVDDRAGALPDCAAPVLAEGVSCDLDLFPPGTNAGPLSPHGGLRISLRELLVIGKMLASGGMHEGRRFLRAETIAAFRKAVWQLDTAGSNGNTGKGTMCGYGTGLHLLGPARPGCDTPFVDGNERYGHAAEAYGLLGGLWVAPSSGEVIVYFATGSSVDPLPLMTHGDWGWTTLERALARRAAQE